MSGKQTQKKATRETKIDDFPVEELEKAKKFIQNGQAEGDVNNEINSENIADDNIKHIIIEPKKKK